MTGCAPLQTVRLMGVAALAPEVNAAKNLVRLQPGSDAFKAALATLQQINGFAPVCPVLPVAAEWSLCAAGTSCMAVCCN